MELDRRRIAVLPFSNMSPDPNDEYFADGMTEELIATVSKISEISVVSRTSVMQYRKNPKPIRDVAEELQAGSILEGSVRKARDKVRITVQLVDAALDKHVWSESYDRGLEDIFAIQSDISRNVADVLKIRLLAKDQQRLQNIPTRNVDAYSQYLKGRTYLTARTEEGFEKAIRCFEEAIKHDPTYASAYAGLADSYGLLENWSFMRPQLAWPKSLEYAVKALEIDDSLAEAHTSLAECLTHMKRDWKGAEKEYRRALELNPSYATGHQWYSIDLLMVEGRWDEAVREIEEAAKLDPFSAIIAVNKATIMFRAARRDEAMGQFRVALKINPEFSMAHAEYGIALIATSSIDEGTRELERALELSTENLWASAGLAYAHVRAERRSEAERILDELKGRASRRYVPGTVIAATCAVLGEEDQAFEWLNRAVQEGSSTIAALAQPLFDGLRTDPRFENLRERIGLTANPSPN